MVNLLEIIKAEISYRHSLRLLSEPEPNRELIAEKLRSYGYDIRPDDFLGSSLMTGPQDRKYLKDKYGVTFYPSTILIPEESWLPPEYGGKGVITRLLMECLPRRDGNYSPALCIRFRRRPFPCIKLSSEMFREKKSFHEDFHERYSLRRPFDLTHEEDALNELHSYHSDYDEGIHSLEYIKERLCTIFPRFSNQIGAIMDSLPRLEETMGDRGIEQLLLKASSLDYILRQANA